MKLSNKLLLGLLFAVLLGITAVLGTAKYYALDKSATLTPVQQNAPQPPAPPGTAE
ncbi:hypothetical protein [Pontibacter actiniarum]|uniref:hypothetical protein n=1 Tax=Pontibacter actiniarum TaxID=323450 RepID=UPI0004189524|nr:hypothetical protein [Pontibacter actiniarum]